MGQWPIFFAKDTPRNAAAMIQNQAGWQQQGTDVFFEEEEDGGRGKTTLSAGGGATIDEITDVPTIRGLRSHYRFKFYCCDASEPPAKQAAWLRRTKAKWHAMIAEAVYPFLSSEEL